MVKKQEAKNLLQIKVQLMDFKPSIYRTFIVSEDDNFLNLNNYIQNSFGFEGYHLWHFFKRSVNKNILEIIEIYEDFEAYFDKTLNPKKTKLSKIFLEDNIDKLIYEYDFGDSWEFEVSLQKVIPNTGGIKVPLLCKLKGGNLIEDCGGVWGLSELLEKYKNKIFDNDIFENWEEFEEYMEPFIVGIEDINNFKL